MNITNKNLGVFFAVLSTGLSSIAIIYQAAVAKVFPVIFLASFANLLGAILVASSFWFQKKTLKPNLPQGQLRNLIILAMLRNVIGSLLFWWALGHTQAIKAMFFTKAEPYFILAWNWLLDKKTTKKYHLLLLAIHLFGAIILSTGGKFEFNSSQSGDITLVVAVCVLGLSYRFGAAVSSSIGALETSVFAQLIGGVILLPLALSCGASNVLKIPQLSWEQFIFSILLWNVFGFSFWLLALQKVQGWIVSALRALGPLIAAPLAYLFFNETLSGLQISGAALVLITSMMITKERSN